MPERFVRRWGPLDECGARNLVDEAATLRGLSSVRTGRVLSLAVEIRGGSRGPAAPNRAPVQHMMVRDGGDYAAGMPEEHGFAFADDVIFMPTQGTTHVDALCHVWSKGKMYNGFSSDEVKSRGANRCGIEKLQPIVTRAIFADLASAEPSPETIADHPITRDELVAAIERGGIAPEPGDALLVRTGWMRAWKLGLARPLLAPGLHHDCADWIVEQGFALVAADNPAVEVLPSRDPASSAPLHLRLLRDNGVYLAELLDLDELAQAGRVAMMLAVAPLRIKGGTGSPINPVAVL